MKDEKNKVQRKRMNTKRLKKKIPFVRPLVDTTINAQSERGEGDVFG